MALPCSNASFLKSCFWYFPSEYNSSNGNHHFWSGKGDYLGGGIPLDYPFPKAYFSLEQSNATRFLLT